MAKAEAIMIPAESRRARLARHLDRASARETSENAKHVLIGLAIAAFIGGGVLALDSLYATETTAPGRADAVGTLAPSDATMAIAVGSDTFALPRSPEAARFGIAGETAVAPATAHAKWRGMLARHEASLLSGPGAAGGAPPDGGGAQPARDWRALIGSLEPLTRREQAARVHTFFNRFDTGTDPGLWQVRDYWAAPLEMMAVGAGDSEDVAIAKFLALRAAGFSDSDLRLLVVADTAEGGRTHAVMTANLHEGVPHGKLVLDGHNRDIAGDEALRRYKPIYGLNGESFYAYGLDALHYERTR